MANKITEIWKRYGSKIQELSLFFCYFLNQVYGNVRQMVVTTQLYN